MQIDAVASRLSSHEPAPRRTFTENGIVAKSQWETAAYGAWSLDASARIGGSDQGRSEQGQGGVVTLRQRGMPFDGGWQADNALGDLNAPDIGLARLQPRFYLPTGPMQGSTTEWRGPSGLQIVAGGGVPGLYDGIEVPNFRTLDGSTATAGAAVVAGLALDDGRPVHRGSRREPRHRTGDRRLDAHVLHHRTAHRRVAGSRRASSDESARWRSQRQSATPSAAGSTGRSHRGSIQQNAGLFRIDPNMTWGNQLIANDAQGGYYRLDYQSRQWLADVGVDEVRSVSGSRHQHDVSHRRYALSAVPRLGRGRSRQYEPQRRRHRLVAAKATSIT